ncbi:Alpha/Beta hydrolase protein [Apiospora kogelbergensis]|uniref:Alpha/Beta hydrolase protein n=1 Tax=Apiospora kogelbergensis TaxID=1337665 RepID=UPI00312E1036
MSNTTQWPDESVFDPFNITEETYKMVDGHKIQAAILVPKVLDPGTAHPLIINIHGGFLVTGHSLFPTFFSPWIADLAVKNSAIIVSADHRLLPSARGIIDVVEDLEDFWQWTRSGMLEASLNRLVPGHSFDLAKVLLAGSSAGGYGASQLALSHPDDISALAMAYPFVDPQDPIILEGPGPDEPTILRFPQDQILSREVAAAWIEETRKAGVTTKAGAERTPFCVAAAQHGIFYSLVIDNAKLMRPEFLPLERLKAGARLPKKVWILHGDQDSVVHIRTSRAFADLITERLPKTTLRFDVGEGEDHAFDLHPPSWETHAPGALDFVRDAWLKT